MQKYGGTSVADPDRIKAVADHIVATRWSGAEVLVVVSAMGSTTDELEHLAHEVSSAPSGRELDMLLTAGERISIALLCMAIIDRGEHAVSLTGSQAGILTDTTHGRAKIVEVRAERLRETLATGAIAVVAGFQGVSTSADITTLGRGGSDTTAVALAAALDADVCEIYTDVTGVFTADPRIVAGAVKLPRISHEEMLEMAAMGSKVLALRSVEFARNYDVPLHVRSSFSPDEGTWILKETPDMEQAIVSGIAHKSDEAKITITGVHDQPGVAASIFTVLADALINVDTIIQNTGSDGRADLSFTLPLDELSRARDVLDTIKGSLEYTSITADDQIGKVTLVGAGMKSNPGIAAKMFRVLSDKDINILMIDTSTIRITVVINRRDIERAVRALHDAFDLEAEAARRGNV